ncbi:MAG: ATP-binding protein [Pseudomonadota bacterium]
MSAIAISVMLRSDKSKRESLFLILTMSLALYYTFSFIYMWQQSEIFLKIMLAGALVVPNTVLQFFRAFVGSGEKRRSKLSLFLRISSVIIAVITLPPLLHPQLSGILVAAFVGIMLYVSIFYLYRKSRKVESKVEETRILYLVLVGLAAVTFSFTDLLLIVGIPFLPIGTLIASVYLYLFSQAIFSYRLMDLYELFGRMAVLGALALTIAGIFSVLTLFEMASTSFFVNAMAAAFVMLIVFDPLREKVEQRIGEFFLKEKTDFVNSIEDTRREIARAFEIEGITSTLMEGLKKSGRLTNACFYAIDEVGQKFQMKGFLGQRPPEEINVAAARPVLDRIEEGGHIIAETLRREQKQMKAREEEEKEEEDKSAEDKGSRAAELESILSLLGDLKSEAMVPVKESDKIYGFIGVKDERFRYAFSPDDISLLRSLGGHVAVAIENTRLYEKIKERDRLVAIGEMSAGLAHEIRNPLGAIKGAVQFITEDNEETRSKDGNSQNDREFLDIIISEVDRLNKVVSSFLDYARPSHTVDEKAASDVNSVIMQTKKLVENEIAQMNVKVEFNLEDDLRKVHLSDEKLGQVLWNLLTNAIEATVDSGKEREVIVSSAKVNSPVSWTSLNKASGRGFIEISVQDNGRGIVPSVLPKIFIPFYTTKPKGTGLGLSISHRIIREAGGLLEVDTKEGGGTTFRVLLPAL